MYTDIDKGYYTAVTDTIANNMTQDEINEGAVSAHFSRNFRAFHALLIRPRIKNAHGLRNFGGKALIDHISPENLYTASYIAR